MIDFDIRELITEFVEKKDSYKNFENEVCSRILGQPEVVEITFNIFMWLKSIAYNKKINNNMILAGPSGSGKTETYRVIEDILSREIGGTLPVIRLDLSMLTQEGYAGMDNGEFFKPLVERSTEGIAIVVLDEMDKRLMPSFESKGGNVNQNIQSQILTIIEGIEMSSICDDTVTKTIDTSNTLFIGAGTFESVRSKREVFAKAIGFNRDAENVSCYEDSITMEDIISAGAINELIGRFTTVVNFQKLSRNDIAVLLRRYADELSGIFGYTIIVEPSALDGFYEEYCASKFGCRLIRSNLYNRLVKKCREIELLSNSEKCMIDVLVVNDKGVRIEKSLENRPIFHKKYA